MTNVTEETFAIGLLCFLFSLRKEAEIRFRAGGVEVIPEGVDNYSEREIFNLQAADSLTAEIRPGNHFTGGDAGGEIRTGTAGSTKINSAVFHDGGDDFFTAKAFADDDLIAPVKKERGERIHPPGGGGAGRADDAAGLFRRRADVINSGAAQIKGERLTGCKALRHAGMSLITRGVNNAGEQNAVTGAKRLQLIPQNGRGERKRCRRQCRRER